MVVACIKTRDAHVIEELELLYGGLYKFSLFFHCESCSLCVLRSEWNECRSADDQWDDQWMVNSNNN